MRQGRRPEIERLHGATPAVDSGSLRTANSAAVDPLDPGDALSTVGAPRGDFSDPQTLFITDQFDDRQITEEPPLPCEAITRGRRFDQSTREQFPPRCGA